MYKAILLFGPPFSGKGTQGKTLGERPGFYHFSTGDMFRSLDTATDVGMRVQALINEGAYVPDDLTMQLFYQTLRRDISAGVYDPDSETLILDGMPRTLGQVGGLEGLVHVEKAVHIYFHLEDLVPLKARMLQRAKEEGRVDDSESKFDARITNYMDQTVPVITRCRGQFPFVSVYGMGTKEEVHERVLRSLG